MQKKHYLVLIIVFAAFLLGLMGLSLLQPDREFSENENRYLQTLPQPTAADIQSGKFGDTVENYLSDQMWLRDRWTALRSRVKMLLQNKDIGGVYLCEDGYYVEKFTRNDLNEKLFASNLKNLCDFFRRCGEIETVEHITFMPVPTPGYFLKEKLPRYAELFDQDAVFDTIAAALPESTDLLDLRQDFAGAMDDVQLFYRTDHHWTTAGAFLAYTLWQQSVGLPAPDAGRFTAEQYPGFRGTLYSKVLDVGAAFDTIELYRTEGDTALTVTYSGTGHESCYELTALAEKDMYKVFFGGNWPIVTITGGEKNGRHLLVLKDSYANAFLPFAAMDYESITVVDLRYYLGSLTAQMQTDGTTDVLVLYSVTNFLTDTNMARLAFG